MPVIRRLSPDDSEEATRFVELFGTPEAGLKDLTPWLAIDSNVMIGAWIDETPAGLVFGYHLPHLEARPDMFLLFSIDVDKRFRRRGIGKALVRACREEARGTLWVITSEDNAAGMALYPSAGAIRPYTDDVMFRIPAGG
jgi:GNAT superfamily N-acetyltransferase